MAVTLLTALSQHQITDFNTIGARNWTYLSYDGIQGWDIVKFEGICGFFQQIFRWLFGCYANTHLTTIAHAIEREAASSVPSELLAKIRAAWARQGGAAIGPSLETDPNSWRVGNTRFSIQQGDITQLQIQAIVNPTNPQCVGRGDGINGAIHRAAGPSLLEECRRLPAGAAGERCPTGDAVVTGSGNLAPGIQHIIHTVGPDVRLDPDNPIAFPRNHNGWRGYDEAVVSAYVRNIVRSCCMGVLAEAVGLQIREVAFPVLSNRYLLDFVTRATMEVVQEEIGSRYPNCFDRIVFIFDPINMQTASSLMDEFRRLSALRSRMASTSSSSSS
jgi:O-acetyl-ADP-ribose deacetylase (regulator of RNase III)